MKKSLFGLLMIAALWLTVPRAADGAESRAVSSCARRA
jgi:hypothetical protein